MNATVTLHWPKNDAHIAVPCDDTIQPNLDHSKGFCNCTVHNVAVGWVLAEKNKKIKKE